MLFSLIPLSAKLIGLVAVLGGLTWMVDEIGDRREAKVRGEYAEQIRQADARASAAETQWKAHYESESAKRSAIMDEILAETKARKAGAFEPSPALLAKLNAIKPRSR